MGHHRGATDAQVSANCPLIIVDLTKSAATNGRKEPPRIDPEADAPFVQFPNSLVIGEVEKLGDLHSIQFNIFKGNQLCMRAVSILNVFFSTPQLDNCAMEELAQRSVDC